MTFLSMCLCSWVKSQPLLKLRLPAISDIGQTETQRGSFLCRLQWLVLGGNSVNTHTHTLVACTHTLMHTHTHTYAHNHKHTHTCTQMFVHTLTHLCTHSQTHSCTCSHTRRTFLSPEVCKLCALTVNHVLTLWGGLPSFSPMNRICIKEMQNFE